MYLEHRRGIERCEGEMLHNELSQKLYVGGEWAGSTASGNIFEVTNPANGKVVAALPDASAEDMRKAIDLAATAQREWAETTAAYRVGILSEAARLPRVVREILRLSGPKPLGPPAR